MPIKILIVFAVGMVLSSYQERVTFTGSSVTSQESLIRQVPDELKTNCYICHNPKAASHNAILAPPLAIVKIRYTRKYATQAQFVNSMTSFLLAPTKEKAIMYGAIDRFGLMTATVFDEKTTRRIVEYIYSNKLEEPSWLQEEMGNRGMN
jgi:hypothetical protein